MLIDVILISKCIVSIAKNEENTWKKLLCEIEVEFNYFILLLIVFMLLKSIVNN